MKGLRYQVGGNWAERAQKAAEDLSDLRANRGYLALTDMLEGDLRALWRLWVDDAVDAGRAERYRQEAMILVKLLATMEGATSEKDLQEMQARAYEGFMTDEQMAAAHAEALNQAGQSPPEGGGVYA